MAQAIFAAKEEGKQVAIVVDDTDVYMMLLYHYHVESLTIPMKLHSIQTGRACIDVTATVHMLKDTVLDLLPAHALSRCDTVTMCYGIGKSKVLKTVNCKVDKCSLSLLGDESANMDGIIKQAIAFMCKCYNVANVSMTEARIRVWTAKTGRKTAAKIS